MRRDGLVASLFVKLPVPVPRPADLVDQWVVFILDALDSPLRLRPEPLIGNLLCGNRRPVPQGAVGHIRLRRALCFIEQGGVTLRLGLNGKIVAHRNETGHGHVARRGNVYRASFGTRLLYALEGVRYGLRERPSGRGGGHRVGRRGNGDVWDSRFPFIGNQLLGGVDSFLLRRVLGHRNILRRATIRNGLTHDAVSNSAPVPALGRPDVNLRRVVSDVDAPTANMLCRHRVNRLLANDVIRDGRTALRKWPVNLRNVRPVNRRLRRTQDRAGRINGVIHRTG